MSIGMILLVVVAVLTLFGVSQRVLDGMRLNDKAALAVIAAMFIGGLIPDIAITDRISFNIGGALIPFALCVYLFVKAGTTKERVRTIIGIVVTTGVVYALGRLMPNEPEAIVIDPNYIYGIVGGIVAYIAGRSRRGAFISGVMGVLLADIINTIVMATRGMAYNLKLGGGSYFDVIVLSGLIAVILAEVVGEFIEMIANRRKEKLAKEGEDHE